MGFFTSSPVAPVEGKLFNANLSSAFFDALGAANLYQDPSGQTSFYHLDTFDPNSYAATQAKQNLTTPTNRNLAGAQQSWQPWDGGTSYLANYLTHGAQGNPAFPQAMQNMQQYGTQGGYPGQLMHTMAQYGGTGGTGNAAQLNQLTYGAPSQAGQYMANMAQFGVPSAAGQYLAQLGAGGGPAMSMLQPFMNRGAGWQSPTIPTRQTYRLGTRLSPPTGYNLPAPGQ